jgi:hypothetical protein
MNAINPFPAFFYKFPEEEDYKTDAVLSSWTISDGSVKHKSALSNPCTSPSPPSASN